MPVKATYAELHEKPGRKDYRQDSRKWFKASKDQCHLALMATVQSLVTKQRWRQHSDELAMKLYADMNYVGYRADFSTFGADQLIQTRLGDSVIRQLVRYKDAKLARRRSRPFVVTDTGSWKDRMDAENLEKWLLGKLRETRFDAEKAPKLRIQGLVFGTGFVRTFWTPKRGASLEIIPSYEVFVDDSQARYGEPRDLYIVRSIDRDVLKTAYPKFKKQIDDASGDRHVFEHLLSHWHEEDDADSVIVVEGYHLPSGPDAGDGKHIIACSSATLNCREWKRDHFPLASFRPEQRAAGFYGIGIPEDITFAQIEINASGIARQEMIDMLANPYWLIERSSKVELADISDVPGRILSWTNTGQNSAPQIVTPPAVPNDINQNIATLKANVMEGHGVNQQAMMGKSGVGYNSSKALRAAREAEDEMSTSMIQSYEDCIQRISELLIEEQIEAGEEADGQSVTYVGRGEMEKITWSSKRFKNALDRCVIEVSQASALASTLSARIEDVYDLRDLQVIQDPEELWDYLDLPDKRRMRRKGLSHRKLLEKVIEYRIVEKGEVVQPEPTWNLALAIQMASAQLDELATYEDAGEDRKDLLRDFISRCDLIVQDAEKQLAAQQEAEIAAQMEAEALQAQGMGAQAGPGMPMPPQPAPPGVPGPAAPLPGMPTSMDPTMMPQG